MKTEITLNDANDKPSITISSTDKQDYINIKMAGEHTSKEVLLKELKAALRKLSTK